MRRHSLNKTTCFTLLVALAFSCLGEGLRAEFIRADADGAVEINDAIQTLGYIILGSPSELS